MSNVNLTASKESGYLVTTDSMLLEYALMYPQIVVALVLGVKIYLEGLKQAEGTVFIMLFVLVLILTAFSFYQIKSIKILTFIKYNLAKAGTRKAIRNLANEQGWTIENDNQNYFIAITKPRVLIGKEITVIYAADGLYANVRLGYGIRGRFPFTFGNRKIVGLIKKRISAPMLSQH